LNLWLQGATAFAEADLKEIFRDRQAMFWTFFFPIMFMVLLGLVFGNAQVIDLKVGVINNDDGPLGAGLTEQLDGLDNVKVENFTSQGEAMAALEKGDLAVFIVIPHNYTQVVSSVDPQNITNATATTTVAVFYADDTAGNGAVASIVLDRVFGGVNAVVTQQKVIIGTEPNEVQVSGGRYIDYLMPGIIGMVLMFNGVFAIAGVMTTMRQKGILRRLKVTPVGKSAILAALITTRMIVTFMGVLLIIAVGIFGFGVQMHGNPLVTLSLVVVGSLSFTTFGFAVSSYAKTLESAEGLANVVTMPMMFLGDVFLPVALMPDFIRPFAEALPLRYLNEALRGVIINGLGFLDIVASLAGVAVWGALGFILAVMLFKWD
jgi:ABC-2 type transport system permease protein